MRARIQEATLECLNELGYAGTSFTEVSRRADVSRGALQHHYGSKAFLIAHTMETLTTRLVEHIDTTAAGTSPGATEVLDALWRAAITPPIPMMTEIRAALRTDSELREILQPLEKAARRHQCAVIAKALGPGLAQTPDFPLRFDGLMATIRGLSVQLFYQGWGRKETELAWAIARDDFLAGLERAAKAG
jgi:AcrR family transcriptional regulator